MAKKKTWKEKLHDVKDFPRVEKLTGKMINQWGEGTIVIPTPIEVDELMRKIPKGKLTTINQIRNILAQKHGATIACPICTGIFARIAAGAAEEDLQEGNNDITPYWRTLKSDGEINPKYPGGVQKQIEMLEEEGHTIIPKGKSKFRVAEFEKSLC
ncbi:MAG: MGMT family protein [Bacteroidetes bacterium]|nr:MGMT family protein [Bacteroidota bacterium]MBU2508528.1 MGMT family protein [Bacteroidota bacterium]